MDQDGSVFSFFAKRMDWLSQRQGLIVKNIANADTPDYRPQDLRESQFRRALLREAGGSLAPTRTQKVHLSGAPGDMTDRPGNRRDLYEASPSGNAVILEQELATMGQTQNQHELMVSLYKKYMTMMKTAVRGSR